MKENKRILAKIKEIIFKFFSKKKNLPSPKEEKNKDEKSIQLPQNDKSENSNLLKNQYKEDFIEMLRRLPNDIPLNEIEDLVNELNDYTFPQNLEGYEFKINTILDNNSPKNLYVCCLTKSGEVNEENNLPICSIANKKDAISVEKYLTLLKDNIFDENKSKLIIESFNDNFKIIDDFHLNKIFDKISNEHSDMITIEVDYQYKKTSKGLQIIKSNRKLSKEDKEK